MVVIGFRIMVYIIYIWRFYSVKVICIGLEKNYRGEQLKLFMTLKTRRYADINESIIYTFER